MTEGILNFETLKQIVGNSKEEMASFYELFKEQTGLDIQEFNQYIQEKNYTEISKIAHKLKSSYGSIGSQSGYEVLATLEKASKENEDFGNIESLYAKFLGIQMKILSEFENYIKT
ncbi:MAG: Hpt domain-containing protein [Ignavibacteriae bacterium]|nr:Hpt domain-containing protein [Ignavibacteriota bacterium]